MISRKEETNLAIFVNSNCVMKFFLKSCVLSLFRRLCHMWVFFSFFFSFLRDVYVMWYSMSLLNPIIMYNSAVEIINRKQIMLFLLIIVENKFQELFTSIATF